MRSIEKAGGRAAAVVALTGAAALAATPGALAAQHRHHGHRAVRTLKITAEDSAATPFQDDHPHFVLSLRHRQSVAAGLVKVTLVNRSHVMEHQAQLARLHRGVSADDFVAAARTHGDDAAMALVDPSGGADTVAPGGRQTTFQRLRRGRYVVVCLVTMPDGKSHLDLGMVTSFRVKGRPTGHKRPHGHVKGTIKAETTGSGMTFELPRHFSGHGLYRFQDAKGDDPHELSIVRLLPGKTVQDLIAWFTHPGPPPFTGAGGFGAVTPHHGGWLRLHLEPGHYVTTCFVPDEKTGLPHGAMGMDVAFTIR